MGNVFKMTNVEEIKQKSCFLIRCYSCEMYRPPYYDDTTASLKYKPRYLGLCEQLGKHDIINDEVLVELVASNH